jgi:hypothetical protein
MADDRGRSGRKTTIEIPLTSIRKYVPGSGPPPPRITLVPPRDSTAYIIDQFVLPTEKDTTETSRRLIHYHIGFTDLPAAKLLVPCNQVLDYVSPRELEDWEYANLEKKEEERARLLAEKERAGPVQRKPGRPPKVPMEDVGAAVLSPADEALLLAQEIAGPSLSTPRKRKLGRMLDEEDIGDTSNIESDGSTLGPHPQGDEDEFDSMEYDEDAEAKLESVDQRTFDYTSTDVDTPSRAGSSVPLIQHPSLASVAIQQLGADVVGAPLPDRGRSFTPVSGGIHPAWANAFGQKRRSEAPQKVLGQNGHTQQNGKSWSLPAMSRHINRSPFTSPSASAPTPLKVAKASASKFTSHSARASSAVPSDSSRSKRKAQLPNGNASAGKQQKEKKQKTKHNEQPPAEEWEVKELLDDGWVDEHGVSVHKYLVLWEGDWPEDQNPTWEPAENILDEDLIRRYHKKKAGLLHPARKKTQKTLHQYMVAPQYSSVAEAFEGGIEQQLGPMAVNIESDTDPPNETFLVTENIGDISASGANASPSFRTFDSMLARYNQSFQRP